MKPVYGNAFAVHDPDPRELDRIERALEGRWSVTRPAAGWLLAVATINDMCAPQVKSWPGGGTIVWAEDSTGRCDVDAVTTARLQDVAPDGDVTAIAVHKGGVRAVRSCAGLVPLYIARQGMRVAVSTQIAPLVDVVLQDVAIDELGAAAWVSPSARFPDGRTWIRDVRMQPAGHAADVGSERTTTHRYWDPRPGQLDRPTEASRREHVETLRHAVLSSLQANLDPDGRNLLTLSGGADSTLLAYLIAGSLRLPFSTLTLTSTAPEELAEQQRVIGAFASAHPPKRQWFQGHSTADRIEMIERGPDLPLPLLHPALQVLPLLAREHEIAVLVGGEFADHFAGGGHHLKDWFEQHSLPAVAAAIARRRSPGGPTDAMRWFKWRLRPAPALPQLREFLARPLREEFDEWRDRRLAQFATDRRPWRHFALRMERESGGAVMNWEGCSAAGVLRVIPFLSRATIENIYRCRADELIGPGFKRLMRAAFAGDAPANVLDIEKYRGRAAVHPTIAIEPIEQIRPLLGSPGPFHGVDGLMVATLNRFAANLDQGKSADSGL